MCTGETDWQSTHILASKKHETMSSSCLALCLLIRRWHVEDVNSCLGPRRHISFDQVRAHDQTTCLGERWMTEPPSPCGCLWWAMQVPFYPTYVVYIRTAFVARITVTEAVQERMTHLSSSMLGHRDGTENVRVWINNIIIYLIWSKRLHAYCTDWPQTENRKSV